MGGLEAARAAISAGQFTVARDALVEAWRDRRSPAIAVLVERIAARAPDELTTRLAQTITSRVATTLERVIALRGIDDPRVSGFAIATLSCLPFASTSAVGLIGELIDRVAALRDSRLFEHRWAIDGQISSRIKLYPKRSNLQYRLRLALAAVGDAIEPTSDELDLVQSLAPARTSESLLADIHANPDDNAPRLVLADLLLERGDPRGELIAMQLARGEKPASKRERELLAKHGKEWLGILAPVLGWRRTRTEFRRGFLAVADIIKSVDRKLMSLYDHPAWATIEELRGSWEGSLLVEAPFPVLRVIDGPLHPKLVARIATRAEPLARVREIVVEGEVDPEVLRAAFPGLETVRTAARGEGSVTTT